MSEDREHLTEDQLTIAVVDEHELGDATGAHRRECASCRGARVLLEEELARVGRMAVEFSPVPAQKPLFRAERAPVRFAWNFRPAFAMAFAAACLLVLMLAPWHLRRNETNFDKIYQEMAQDQKLLAEVEKLEENPFPMGIPGLSDREGTDEFDQKPPSGQGTVS